MEIICIYALHSNSLAAASRHLIVASANGQSVTHFHVFVTRFVSTMLCSGFDYVINWNVGIGND